MIFNIKGKTGRKAGHLNIIGDSFKLQLSIQKKRRFFKELQKLLIKHFDVKILSNGQKITNSLIIDKLKDDYNSTERRNTGEGRGSRIGDCFKEQKRYQTDEEYREYKRKYKREYYSKNKEKELKKYHKWKNKMNEFANKRCKFCGKLMFYRSVKRICQSCWKKGKRK